MCMAKNRHCDKSRKRWPLAFSAFPTKFVIYKDFQIEEVYNFVEKVYKAFSSPFRKNSTIKELLTMTFWSTFSDV